VQKAKKDLTLDPNVSLRAVGLFLVHERKEHRKNTNRDALES